MDWSAVISGWLLPTPIVLYLFANQLLLVCILGSGLLVKMRDSNSSMAAIVSLIPDLIII